MGCAFELVVGADEENFAMDQLQKGVKEIQRIEKMLSEFSDASITFKVNKSAGIRPVRVPSEFYKLMRRCMLLSDLTQGAFDITVGPLKKRYEFRGSEVKLPSGDSIKQALDFTGYRKIRLEENNTVSFDRKHMAISFASIGKGYAADCVKRMWLAAGVKSGVINASGDLCMIGKKPDGSPWKIGVPNPEEKSEMLLYLPVESGALATSGDYEQFFIINGKRYSHTINPLTGRPVSGIKSVTVTGSSAELSDAFATAVTVLGVEVGIHFINQMPGVHCLIIDDNSKLHCSKNIIFEKTN